MIIKTKVHPNSSQVKIEKIKNGFYEVWIKEKPVDGNANSALEKFLKREFGFKCKVISGFTSKIKKVEVFGK
jgi:uncharacterized protein YggU (UPF0235/DUF167 family)